MKKAAPEDPRLTNVTAICQALPETSRDCAESHAVFRVRKKVFAYFLNDHHGDGIVAVACKALPGDNALLIRAHPERFYLPAYVGPRGWVALRLDVADVDWDEVAELIRGSYLLTAPKRLTAR